MKKILFGLLILASCSKSNVKPTPKDYFLYVNIDWSAQSWVDSVAVNGDMVLSKTMGPNGHFKSSLVAGQVDIYVYGGGGGDWIDMTELKDGGNHFFSYIPPPLPYYHKYSMMASGSADVQVDITKH